MNAESLAETLSKQRTMNGWVYPVRVLRENGLFERVDSSIPTVAEKEFLLGMYM